MVLLANAQLTVQRYQGGYYELGKWIEGDPNMPFTINANIQPASGRDMQTYAEGRRVKAMMKCVSDVPIYTSDPVDGTTRDTITYQSDTWEVIHISDYSDSKVAPHYEFVICRMLEGTFYNVPVE